MAQIPGDLSAALTKAGLAGFFAEGTGPHRHEYLKWIAGAKRPETRTARISKAMEMLLAKRAEEGAGAPNRKSRIANR